jgi:hypothetical protein
MAPTITIPLTRTGALSVGVRRAASSRRDTPAHLGTPLFKLPVAHLELFATGSHHECGLRRRRV